MAGNHEDSIWVDGRSYDAEPERNLLEVCLGLGFDLPYFCWHPALGSVGACRQCAVKQFKDEAAERDGRGKLVMACMTPATAGTRISIDDGEARQFRQSVIEWLMVNHPHDCPVCDEGGECHLQDMTVATGHNYRRYRFGKRTYRNQDLGPFVNHEMNRCIQCYRCVRFYAEHAGGRDLQAFGAHDHVYFGRREDGTLESELSGNLVEICPTGVFTDKTLKHHYTRKWDLQCAPSVCVHCSLGCNTTPGERYGKLRRIRARYHGHVNGYFLCDRGRYGYEFVNHRRRIRRPLLPRRGEERATPISVDEARERLIELLGESEAVLGIGSPRASLESNFALRRLVGAERFYRGTGEAETALVDEVVELLRRGPARTPSLREVERCDAVLVLGEDVVETAPLLGLALRQSVRREPERAAASLGIPRWNDAAMREAIQDRRGPLWIATPYPTRLDELARGVHRAAPEDVACLGFAVAHALDSDAPVPTALPETLLGLAGEIAGTLAGAERPLVVSGVGSGSKAVIQAAAHVAWALCRRRGGTADLSYVLPECNSFGAALLGGPPLEEALTAMREGRAASVLVLENDLFRRAPAEVVREALRAVRHLVVLDHVAQPTAREAELVLPAATFAEADGTLVNNEGRAQRFFRVFVPGDEIRESWRWLSDAARDAGRTATTFPGLDDLVEAMGAELPVVAGVKGVAPPSTMRWAGAKIPRAQHRYSGRTAMHADRDPHEPPPPNDPDTPLSFSMEGFSGRPPAALVSDFWWPRWNSVQSLNRFQEEIAGPLRGGDPGVRLVEPEARKGDAPSPYVDLVAPPFRPREGRFRLVPLHHVFGCEELSVLSSGVAERAPAPYLALGAEDARELDVDGEGERVRVDLGGRALELPVVVRDGMPRGVAGLPVGLPQLPVAAPPLWVRVEKKRGER